jgi:hypothetical protein
MHRLALAALLTVARTLGAQQVPDRDARPVVTPPAWPAATGPRVCLDEGHHNFHTLSGRYAPFADLLRRDGLRLAAHPGRISARSLGGCDVLVIANAQPSNAPWTEYPIPTPSAFTAGEIDALHRWVDAGGALWLIADHMPLAGAASALAARFGFAFRDGFATAPFASVDSIQAAMDRPSIFRRADGSLRSHAITRGWGDTIVIDSVRTFTGQAFRAPVGAEPLIVLPEDWLLLLPERAWQFTANTTVRPVGGWLQGATLRVGRGRLAVFGEAAMFSAQRAGAERRTMGFNAPDAGQNAQFTLNVVHWLVGRG